MIGRNHTTKLAWGTAKDSYRNEKKRAKKLAKLARFGKLKK